VGYAALFFAFVLCFASGLLHKLKFLVGGNIRRPAAPPDTQNAHNHCLAYIGERNNLSGVVLPQSVTRLKEFAFYPHFFLMAGSVCFSFDLCTGGALTEAEN
jgi:hypothetical protein